MNAVRSALVAFALLLAQTSLAPAQMDPRLRWRTLNTEHFRIHFHQGIDHVARRAAAISEAVFDRLTVAMGWEPTGVTHIVLDDTSDVANGVATAVPYNAIRLFVTAPSDLSPLGDYDEWLTELIVHEFTHVLHLDHIWGIPAVVNAVFGKTLAPNQFHPRWFLEGLAVAEESLHTSGGRLRSTMFDMWLRMDVLEGNFARLDEISSDPRRFPHGHIRYLYGSRFIGYIANRFGEEALRRMVADYARQLIPYGINRMVRRATGRGFSELYGDFRRELTAQYQEQVARIRSWPVSHVRFVTDGAETALSPRFSPDGRSILFARSDSHGRPSVVRVAADGETVHAPDLERLFFTNGDASLSFEPGGTGLVYSHLAPFRDVYAFGDLFRFDVATGKHQRLTRGQRAAAPDIAPDGRIAFTVNRAGTTHLVIADRDGRSPRIVVHSRRFHQVYTPRWSPDASRIAYSAWSSGGYRDIRIVDVRTGLTDELTHDRALDVDPAWSTDGEYLYFSSDRTGVANLYAFEIATRELCQVTNLVSGAYQPDVSPDGRRIVFVGYRSRGFDLGVVEIDSSRFLPAAPAPDLRPSPEFAPAPVRARLTSYDPLPTLRPHSWSLGLGLNAFGNDAVEITTSGRDVVGLHAFAAIGLIDTARGDAEYSLAYSYLGTNPTLQLEHARRLVPRSNYRFDGVGVPWVEQTLAFSAGTSYLLNRNFHDHSLGVFFEVQRLDALEVPDVRLDPSDHPSEPPQTGWVNTIGLSWGYSSAFVPTYGVSAERGRQVSLGTRLGVSQLGSDYFVLEARYSYTEYLAMPWALHHVLALRAAGGIGASDFSRRGLFTLSGFATMDLVDSVSSGVRAPSVVLRGFVPYSRNGNQFHLFNAEYRFPILDLDVGAYTLPVYVSRLYGIAFADWGDAFRGEPDVLDWNLGVGGELLVDMVFGYSIPATFRLGLARGLTARGITDYYVVVGNPF